MITGTWAGGITGAMGDTHQKNRVVRPFLMISPQRVAHRGAFWVLELDTGMYIVVGGPSDPPPFGAALRNRQDDGSSMTLDPSPSDHTVPRMKHQDIISLTLDH